MARAENETVERAIDRSSGARRTTLPSSLAAEERLLGVSVIDEVLGHPVGARVGRSTGRGRSRRPPIEGNVRSLIDGVAAAPAATTAGRRPALAGPAGGGAVGAADPCLCLAGGKQGKNVITLAGPGRRRMPM